MAQHGQHSRDDSEIRGQWFQTTSIGPPGHPEGAVETDCRAKTLFFVSPRDGTFKIVLGSGQDCGDA